MVVRARQPGRYGPVPSLATWILSLSFASVLLSVTGASGSARPEPVCAYATSLEGPRGRGFAVHPNLRRTSQLVWPVTTLIDNGPSENRIDLSFAGDGYVASELASTYAADVDAAVAGMFQAGQANSEINNPFLRYARFFNVHRVDVPSNQSGIDILGGSDVDTTFDCGQHPAAPRLADCAFGYGVEVINASMAAVGVDLALDGVRGWRGLALNTPSYVNAGAYGLSVFAGQHPTSQEIFLHEGAHSWNQIADEYPGNPGVPYTGAEPAEINVTIDPAGTKWAPWLGLVQPEIALISAYEGAQYFEIGKYRPSADSIMRADLAVGFNAPCREKIVRDIYAVVDPLDDWTDNASLQPQSGRLAVAVVDPEVIKVDWEIDGVPVAVDGGGVFDYDLSAMAPGLHTVRALAYDEAVLHAFSDNLDPHPLDLVRSGLEELQQAVTWQILVGNESAVTLDATEYGIGAIAEISVVDNDRVGAGVVLVTVTTSDGDIESLRLTEQTPGQFVGSMATAIGPISTNAVIDLTDGSASAILTVEYQDGDGDTPRVVSETATLITRLSGLVHHFPFDESGGSTTTDIAGGLEGVLVGPSWASGPFGDAALRFTGSDYLDLGADLSSILGGTASVSFAIQTTQTGDVYGWSSPAVIGAKYQGNCCIDVYWGWLDSSGGLNVSAGAWAAAAPTTTPLTGAGWHHIVMTRDATTGVVKMYRDGALDSTASSEIGVMPLSVTSVGRREDKDAGGATIGASYFVGQLDELRIYDRVLTAAEVATAAAIDSLPPVTQDDTLVTALDTPAATVDVRANDTDPEGASLRVIGFTQPANGTVISMGEGRFWYTPAPGYLGADSFSYTVSDGGRSATSSVIVEVSQNPTFVCPDLPEPNCVTGFAASSLLIDERIAGRERVVVKLRKGPEIDPSDLGNPLATGGTAYLLCVYDDMGGLAGSYRVDRAGEECRTRPCWGVIGKAPGSPRHMGYAYKDPDREASGMSRIALAGGPAGRPKILLKGDNSVARGLASLPTGVSGALQNSASATLQIFGNDAGVCLGAVVSDVSRSDGRQFKAR